MGKVLQYPDKELRTKTEEILFSDTTLEERKGLDEAMREEMIKHKGIGIAAPQIGIMKRAAVILDSNSRHISVANLKLTQLVDPYYAVEGCLSSKGRFFIVRRFKAVTAIYADLLTGEKHKIRLAGVPAQIAQHEYDHLVGRTIEEFGKEIK